MIKILFLINVLFPTSNATTANQAVLCHGINGYYANYVACQECRRGQCGKLKRADWDYFQVESTQTLLSFNKGRTMISRTVDKELGNSFNITVNGVGYYVPENAAYPTCPSPRKIFAQSQGQYSFHCWAGYEFLRD